MTFINKKEYRVWGIKRSGNHAIINWIFSQLQGKVVFLNNCYPVGTKKLNIYEGVGRIDCKGINYWDFKNKTFFWEKDPFINKSIVTYSKKDTRFNREKFKQLNKEAIIVNFEDRNIELTKNLFDSSHDILVGSSEKIFSIIILRDPFNLLASIYKKWGEKAFSSSAILWKEYAKIFIEYQQNNNDYLCPISYNQWVTDVTYREKIAAKLQITFTDEGKSEVTNFGGGSSFEGLSSAQQAENMDVLNRWQQFQDDEIFNSVFKDSELVGLSKDIFGFIPNTNILVN